jgi:hypothetical protein
MIRGEVATYIMCQIRTLTYEETRVVRSTDECDDGIANTILSEPPEISSSVSASVYPDQFWEAAQGEDPSKPSRLGSRLARSAGNVFECDDVGIADSIPSEPPELSSGVSALVCQDKSWGAGREDSSSPRVCAQARILVMLRICWRIDSLFGLSGSDKISIRG